MIFIFFKSYADIYIDTLVHGFLKTKDYLLVGIIMGIILGGHTGYALVTKDIGEKDANR